MKVLALVGALLGVPAFADSSRFDPRMLEVQYTPPKGALDHSKVETVRVDGRLYEVRVASTEAEGEHQLLIVRATIVIDPDPELESRRNWNVVQPFMQRTCKSHFVVLESHLVDKVNLYIRFRCGG
jgi:hypothetical protein